MNKTDAGNFHVLDYRKFVPGPMCCVAVAPTSLP